MIRNKAIVNEENSDAEYWRKKFLALLKNTSNSLSSNPGSKQSSSEPMMIMNVDEGNNTMNYSMNNHFSKNNR